ncbi:MAG: VWA domain-containing protein [bacterium]
MKKLLLTGCLLASLLFFIVALIFVLAMYWNSRHPDAGTGSNTTIALDPALWNQDTDQDKIDDYTESVLGYNVKQTEDTFCKDKIMENCDQEITTDVSKALKNVVIIIDGSTSMNDKIGSETKMEILKATLAEVLPTIQFDAYTKVALMAYGHRIPNDQKTASCEDTEVMYPIATMDVAGFLTKVNTVNTSGWTPLAKSLREAGAMLKNSPLAANSIILISDGKETCDGDPVNEAKALKDAGVVEKVSVIGFSAGDDEASLREIANAGGGDYITASDQASLQSSFENMVKESLNLAKYRICLIKMSNNYSTCIDESYNPAVDYVKQNHPVCKGQTDNMSCIALVGQMTLMRSNLLAEYSLQYINKLQSTGTPGK